MHILHSHNTTRSAGLYVGTTGSSPIPTRARRLKCQDLYPVLPLRRTRGEQHTTTDHNLTIATHHPHRTGRAQAPLWHGDDFVSWHVQTALQYWKENILTALPLRDEFLGYIGGVRLGKFIDLVSEGTFEDSQFKGTDATPIELPNHVSTSHDGWVDTEIEPLVQKGSLAPWSMVAGTKAQPRPRICLPLRV